MPHPRWGSKRKSSRKVPFRPYHPVRGRWPTFDEMKEQKYGEKWHYDRAKYVPDPNQALEDADTNYLAERAAAEGVSLCSVSGGRKSSKRKSKKRRSVGRRTLLKRRKKRTHRRR